MKSILDYSHTEARRFFLKEECYFNFDLPQYFEFGVLIQKISDKIDGKKLSDFYGNYTNENGKVKPTICMYHLSIGLQKKQTGKQY
jgi:aminoglycoside phosphotransferase family enzyme